jgi:hypothetical protein
MIRLRFSLLAAVCLAVLANSAWSAPAPTERSALEQVPATAPLVVHLHGVQHLHDRLVAMMKEALPDVLDKYQAQIDDFFTNGPDDVLKGRKFRGMDKDAHIYFLFTELPKPQGGGIPKMATVITVTNYKEFRDGILTEEERKTLKDEGKGIESATIQGIPNYFLDRKSYAIVTPDKEVAESFTKKQPGLNTKLNKEVTAKLLASDVGVYVNMTSVNKEYAERIKEFKDGIGEKFAPFEAAADESQKKMVALLKKVVGSVFQAVEDMQSVLLTVEMRPGGLAIHTQSNFGSESPTAQLLKDSRPIDFKGLERMPDGRAYYMALKTSAAMYKALGSAMVGLPLGKQGIDSEAAAAAMKELAEAGPNVRLDGYAFPMSGLQVYQYDDPAKAVAAQVKVFKAMAAGDPATMGLKEKPVLKLDAEKYGDLKLNSMELVWDLEKLAEQSGKATEQEKKAFAEVMKGFVGEKTTIWFGSDGKAVVQVAAADWKTARKLLDQYSKGNGTVGEIKAFKDLRKEMPPRASFLMLLDSVNLTATVVEAFRSMIPPGMLPPGWPNLPGKGTAAFIGLAVTMQPQRGSVDVFISSAAAQEFYKAIVKPLIPG